jgi:DNA repair protein SbcC/Rad50
MINELIVQNFQSHHNTKLKFHEGLNIIIGQSNSGKSAILRALRLVIENKPSGDSFITKGQKESNVMMRIDNDDIARVKGKTNNQYFLNEIEYKAFNQDVPEDIKKVINFNDINIQKQLDSPFLLSETSGEIAKFFNKVFNLEKIDTSQQKVKSRITDVKKRIAILEEDLLEDTEKIKSFDWIDEAEKKIKILSDQEKETQKTGHEISELSEIIKDYERIYDSYIALDDFQEMQEKALYFDSELKLIESKKENYAELKELLNNYDSLNETYIDTNIITGLENKAFSISENLELIDEIKDDIMELKNLIHVTENSYLKFKTEKTELENLENRLHEIMPEVCPLCNQKIQ